MHHLAFAIAFHYCFVIAGYSWRGVRAANVMFCQFGALCAASAALVCASFAASFALRAWGVLASLDLPAAASGGGMSMGGGEGGHGDADADARMEASMTLQPNAAWAFLAVLVGVVSAATALALWRLADYIRAHSARFPQVGHAMV